MSSDFNHNYYEPKLCPSCRKPKPGYTYDHMFEDKDSVNRLFFLLSSLIKKLDNDKNDWWKDEDKSDFHHHIHDCKCKKHHHKHEHDWWKHDDKFDFHHHIHDCKCKKHHHKHEHDWWKHEDKSDFHHHNDCKCKKHHHKHEHDWWKHDDKEDHDWIKHVDKYEKHHKKHDCHCKKVFDKPRYKSFNQVELRPSCKKDDDFLMDSSSHDFKHGKYCKCPKCIKLLALESSSMEMHKHSRGIPERIWLSDQLALLFKHDLLNLNHLFNQVNKDKTKDIHHKGSHAKKLPNNIDCHCRKGKDWDKEYHEKLCKCVTKKYYYKGMPLKKFKRSAAPYKKFM